MNNNVQNPPGQGQSKKARQRRARRGSTPQNTKITETLTKETRVTGTSRRSRGPRWDDTNPYLESLMYPEECYGCKIPDPTCIPTGTFKTTFTSMKQANANGVSAFFFFPGWIEEGEGMGVWMQETGASTASNIQYGGPIPLPGMNQSATLYSQCRLVSASLTAEFLGSTLNDQGQVTSLWFVPPDPEQNPIHSVDGAMGAPYAESYPIRNGARIVWRPSSNDDLEFVGMNTDSVAKPVIGMVASALAPSGVAGTVPCTIMFTLVANWEAIPNTVNTNLVNAESSPSNLDWLNTGIRWGQNVFNTVSTLYGASNPVLMGAAQLAGSYARNRLLGNQLTNNRPGQRLLTYNR